MTFILIIHLSLKHQKYIVVKARSESPIVSIVKKDNILHAISS